MLAIKKEHIAFNFTDVIEKKLYIVVHDTGNKGVGANAQAHFDYFNGGNRDASAHDFTDLANIVELVDPNKRAWHCGDGNGINGITNSNSIGIEICVNADGDYDKAVQNAIDLTKYYMQAFGIPLERVVRHYDASYKICPASMSANGWAKWIWFKNQLGGAVSAPVSMPTPQYTYTLISRGSNGDLVIKAQKALMALGYALPNYGADGGFGDETFLATIAFQHDHNLRQDGIIGDGTWNALTNALAEHNEVVVLSIGARGSKVVELQNKLIAHGYGLPQWGADGGFGEETYNAVIALQGAKGLVQDGIVGVNTWAALG